MNEVLSQNEINSLLRGLSGGDVEESFTDTTETVQNYRKFDLTNQERIVRGRMPTMELVHDRFARSFRTSLSKYMGRSCFANVGSIEMVKFGLFMKKLPLPSSLHIYRMPPLSGYALMVVSAPLVFAVIEGLFGGSGQGKVKIEGREYTAIEVRLIGRVVMMALDNLKDAWGPIHPLEFLYVRSEFNPLAIAIVPPTDLVVIVTIEVELEQENAVLTLCTPYSVLEPLRGKLSTGFQSNRLEFESVGVRNRMADNMLQTGANISCQLGEGTIKTGEFLKLGVGDTMMLNTNPLDEAMMLVEGIPKFYARVGQYSGNMAVKITRPIPKHDLINMTDKEIALKNGG
jgi:flagellar motor switch protein FliM